MAYTLTLGPGPVSDSWPIQVAQSLPRCSFSVGLSGSNISALSTKTWTLRIWLLGVIPFPSESVLCLGYAVTNSGRQTPAQHGKLLSSAKMLDVHPINFLFLVVRRALGSTPRPFTEEIALLLLQAYLQLELITSHCSLGTENSIPSRLCKSVPEKHSQFLSFCSAQSEVLPPKMGKLTLGSVSAERQRKPPIRWLPLEIFSICFSRIFYC